MKGYFHRVSEQTATKFWINNVTRDQAEKAIEAGAVGCTQNPAYTWKMLSHETEGNYAVDILEDLIVQNPKADANELLVMLQKKLVGFIARDYFMQIFEATQGKFGYVSIQGDPFNEDADTIIKNALLNREEAPNIMAKVPVTVDGLKAIEELSSMGVPINATEVMSVRQAMDVGEAYRRGTKGMKAPAPIFYSHITGILDEYLTKTVVAENIDVCSDTLWQAGMACAKKTYAFTKAKYPELGFIGGGARGLHHFTEMVGADASITINWKGTAEDLILQNPVVVSRFHMPVPEQITDELLEKIPDFKRAFMYKAIEPEEYEEFGPVVLFRTSFETAWSAAREFIAKRIS